MVCDERETRRQTTTRCFPRAAVSSSPCTGAMDGAGDAHKQAQRVASAAAAGGDEIASKLHRRELHNKGASPAGRVSVTETEERH